MSKTLTYNTKINTTKINIKVFNSHPSAIQTNAVYFIISIRFVYPFIAIMNPVASSVYP